MSCNVKLLLPLVHAAGASSSPRKHIASCCESSRQGKEQSGCVWSLLIPADKDLGEAVISKLLASKMVISSGYTCQKATIQHFRFSYISCHASFPLN